MVLYSFGTTIIAGITLFFVLVARAMRTRVDHLGALNRFCRLLSNIGAYSISIIRGKDRAGGTSVGALTKQNTNDGSSDQHCYPHRSLIREVFTLPFSPKREQPKRHGDRRPLSHIGEYNALQYRLPRFLSR